VENKSSEFDKDQNEVRKDGSYVDEEFLPTQGVDLKGYTLGLDYCHVEARKSPVLDGVVERDQDGMEVRYPVLLSQAEKLIAAKVVLAFGQNVCGFDVLRTTEKSYVCDVNGLSLVKKSRKYVEDAAQILRVKMLRAMGESQRPSHKLRGIPEAVACGFFASTAMKGRGLVLEVSERDSVSRIVRAGPSAEPQLRSVLAVLRHGDRTPKQKMKSKTSHPAFIELYRKYSSCQSKEVKFKTVEKMREVFETVCHMLSDIGELPEGPGDPGFMEGDVASKEAQSCWTCGELGHFARDCVQVGKSVVAKGAVSEVDCISVHLLLQIHAVLNRHQFKGINRKLQLKPTMWEVEDEDGEITRVSSFPGMKKEEKKKDNKDKKEKKDKSDVEKKVPGEQSLCSPHSRHGEDGEKGEKGEDGEKGKKGEDGEDGERNVITRDKSMAPDMSPELIKPLPKPWIESPVAKMLPKDKVVRVVEVQIVLKWGGELTNAGHSQALALGEKFRTEMYAEDPCGLLRLHSTFRHDLKIYSSDEGRVQETAASFTKGLLALEGGIAPIMVSLVRKDGINALLDDTSTSERNLDSAKAHLYPLMMSTKPVDEDFIGQVVGDVRSQSVVDSLRKLEPSPNEYLKATWNKVKGIVEQIDVGVLEGRMTLAQMQHKGETPLLMRERWKKLTEDFYSIKKGTFDISKVPDIYDSIKYDIQHNMSLGLEGLDDIFESASVLASVVVSQEYGETKEAKLRIAHGICSSLLCKIRWDLQTGSGFLCEKGEVERGSNANHRVLHRLDSTEFDSAEMNDAMRHVRTRLYFTSESHIVSLFNILKLGSMPDGNGIVNPEARLAMEAINEYNYLTHIVIKMWEDPTKEFDTPARFRVNIFFSMGAYSEVTDDTLYDENRTMPLRPLQIFNNSITLSELEEFLLAHINTIVMERFANFHESEGAQNDHSMSSELTRLAAIRHAIDGRGGGEATTKILRDSIEAQDMICAASNAGSVPAPELEELLILSQETCVPLL